MWQKQQNPQLKQSQATPEKEGLLSRNRYEAGGFDSADQFVVNTPGCLLSGFWRGDACDKFHGGTVFQDDTAGIICIEFQVSLGAGTIVAKVRFEECSGR